MTRRNGGCQRSVLSEKHFQITIINIAYSYSFVKMLITLAVFVYFGCDIIYKTTNLLMPTNILIDEKFERRFIIPRIKL